MVRPPCEEEAPHRPEGSSPSSGPVSAAGTVQGLESFSSYPERCGPSSSIAKAKLKEFLSFARVCDFFLTITPTKL